MDSYENLEKEAEKKSQQRERKRKPKMAITGKSVFKLKELIEKSQGKRMQKLSKKKKS